MFERDVARSMTADKVLVDDFGTATSWETKNKGLAVRRLEGLDST